MSQARLIAAIDIPAALGLLTRLPVPVNGAQATARGAAAAWAWPLAGLAVAVLAALAGWLALLIGLPAGVAAALVLAVQVATTGALHEDGLSDSLDGLWGGATRERRLEIMKDSRIGSYGVLALILSMLLRWSAIAALLAGTGWAAALIAAALLSRGGMVALAAALPFARPGGLAASVGHPPRAAVALALALALVGAFLLTGRAGLAAAVVAALALTLWAAIARARIGGQTGDILGAGQQIGEIAVLLALVAL